MKRKRSSKCLCCKELFQPDYRNRNKQQYCSKPDCRKASKCASQRKWQSKNPDYFSGLSNVQRAQEWRERNAGKCKKQAQARSKRRALQDDCTLQGIDSQREDSSLMKFVLQDDCNVQPAVLVGLISTLTSSALQENIAENIHNLHKRGKEILGLFPGEDNNKARSKDEKEHIKDGSNPTNTRTVQLGGSSPDKRYTPAKVQ